MSTPQRARTTRQPTPIDDLIESAYATVTPATRVHLLRNIFNDAQIVVVEERDEIVGVITKIDLIEYLAERRPK